MALPPPVKPKGGDKASRTLSKVIELSVFDILNIFRRRWFLSRTALLTHVISAQKAEDGDISWVEFDPPFHSHLVKCAVALVPRLGCPVPMVKRVMFVFILELLNQEGHLAFFNLQKGSHKANNAQKEKRRLAWKWSRAAKREQEREATKMAKLPPRERSCLGCGRKFNSQKTAKRHKCPDSKVVRTKEAAVEGSSLHPIPPTKPIMPAALIPPRAPIAPA
jgi:predicted Zn-ribbon and HTH transcriptional regulator